MPDSQIDALFVAFQEALAGRYSLERELGRGGMGVVYLAREVRLDRPVAIKLLPPELAAHPKLRERFMREARTAARLSHPYIVPIHAVDEAAGFVFHIMAYVDGETLAERVRARGPLPPRDVTRILREVAWALAYAHAQGVVHRDIKAANIMLERGTERAMVMDFGIARLATASGETAAGEVLGTPDYMSPEQACGESIDGRSDLYSLGIVGYFALAGSPPFTGSVQEILAQQVTKAAPPVATMARGAPRPLAAVIDKCLSKDRDARFASGEALADALATSLEKRADVPVPLRVFLDRRRNAALIALPTFGAAMLVALIAAMSRGGVTSPRFATAVVVSALIIGGPLAIVSTRLRRLLRHGYGPDDIAAALRALFERRREEFQYEYGLQPSARERLFRVMGIGGLSVGGVSLLAVFASGGGATAVETLAPVMMTGLYVGGLGMVVSNKWRRLRRGTGPEWLWFWQGKFGRLLARIAGLKLGQRAVPADRPTELSIAMSAEALYAGFPKELRKALGDVPVVLHGLEAHARAMRSRIEELDASLLEAQRRPTRAATGALQEKLAADLRSARALAEARLADVVTALETLRLDLLRLHAGAGSPESITKDLASARALSEDVDRLLAGAHEVEQLLGPQQHGVTRT